MNAMKDFLVDSLAVFRLTRLVVEDVITAPARERIFEKHPPTQESWSYALTCPWCASVWIGAGAALARKFFPEVWNPIAEAAAFSAAAGIVSEKMHS